MGKVEKCAGHPGRSNACNRRLDEKVFLERTKEEEGKVSNLNFEKKEKSEKRNEKSLEKGNGKKPAEKN